MNLRAPLRTILSATKLLQARPRWMRSCQLSAYLTRPLIQWRTFTTSRVLAMSANSEDEYEEDEEELEKPLVQPVVSGRDVVVIMPRQKFGTNYRSHQRAQFLLEETITLTQCLPGWRVVGSKMISCDCVNSRYIFGKTNLVDLCDYVEGLNANAVVFALDHVTPPQHHFFADLLNVLVCDRFYLVLQIFRQRAFTKEAKLQLALAELNYLKKNLHFMQQGDFAQFTLAQSFFATEYNPDRGKNRGGETYKQIHLKRLQEREKRLKQMLEKVEKNISVKKKQRVGEQTPTVAIVGYTNSGKTSLIKALTHDSRLVPLDTLFATLDVTVHLAHLPSNLDVLLVDTIGFITEVPTSLVHSFKSTLSEICSAHLVVHIFDCSHPDMLQQQQTVHRTLREIDLPEKLLDTMIEVGNKVDKLEPKRLKQLAQDYLLISTTERIGLDKLTSLIEQGIMDNTDLLRLSIRVPNGGEQYQWLYREVSVVECEADEDANYLIMKVLVTKPQLGKFMKRFGKDSSS